MGERRADMRIRSFDIAKLRVKHYIFSKLNSTKHNVVFLTTSELSGRLGISNYTAGHAMKILKKLDQDLRITKYSDQTWKAELNPVESRVIGLNEFF